MERTGWDLGCISVEFLVRDGGWMGPFTMSLLNSNDEISGKDWKEEYARAWDGELCILRAEVGSRMRP